MTLDVVLAGLAAAAVIATLLVVRADVSHDTRPMRRWVEALIPVVGLVVLLLAVWAAR